MLYLFKLYLTFFYFNYYRSSLYSDLKGSPVFIGKDTKRDCYLNEAEQGVFQMDEDLQVSNNDYEQKEILIHDSHDDLSLSPSSLKHNNLSSNGSASSRYSQTTSHTYVNPYTEDNDAFIELHSFDFIQRMMKEVTEALVIASCENCRYRDYLSSSVPSESDFELFEYHYCSPLSSSMPVTHISYEAAEVEEHESMCNNHMEDDPNNSYDPMYSKSSDISYVNQTQVTNEKGDQNSDDEDWLAWKELADEHYGSLETHESLSEASESSYNEASNLDVNPLEVPYSIYYSSSYLGQSYGNNPYYGVVTNPCVTQTIPQSFYSMPFVMKVVGIAQKARVRDLYEHFFDPSVLVCNHCITIAFFCYSHSF